MVTGELFYPALVASLGVLFMAGVLAFCAEVLPDSAYEMWRFKVTWVLELVQLTRALPWLPWLVAGASEGEFRDGDGGKYRAVVRCLSEVGGLRGRLRRSPDATILGRKGGAANPPPSSMSMVVRAFPQVFDLDVATELAPRIRFLRDEAGIPTEDVHSVIQSFPLILGLDVSTRMRPVVEYVTRQTRTKRNPHVFCWSQLMPCSLKHILFLFYLSF